MNGQVANIQTVDVLMFHARLTTSYGKATAFTDTNIGSPLQFPFRLLSARYESFPANLPVY